MAPEDPSLAEELASTPARVDKEGSVELFRAEKISMTD